MIQKVIQYCKFFRMINIVQFFYLNYFCKSVIRIDSSKIIPYKNVILDIDKSAKIYLCNGDIELGCDLFRKSKVETKVRLREGAVWSSVGGCKISYGATIEILFNAVFDCDYFSMNSNSVIVVAEKVVLGQDVMIGRNVVVYDSDHHQILDEIGEITNHSEPVVINEHVWLATNVLVLKGTIIGAGSIIGANATVSGIVDEQVIFTTEHRAVKKENYGSWDRKSPSMQKKVEGS